MAPYYPQLSREVAEFVKAQAEKKRYVFAGEPLVRFMIDPSLKGGRFSVFAENVDAPTLARLYEEERAYQRGLSQDMTGPAAPRHGAAPSAVGTPTPRQTPEPVRAASGVAGARIPEVASPLEGGFAGEPVADPFAPAAGAAVAAGGAIPVPKTVTREQLAGMGGAAATGGALGAAAGIARNMAQSRAVTTPALAQLIDVVSGETHEITGSACVIGRERATSDIALRDPNVSRRHAQIVYTGQDWSIEDLNSTNGTLVNNRRITRCPLRDGDLLTFGLTTLEFRG